MLLVLGVIGSFGACGSPTGKVDATEPIAECDTYLAAQQRCFPGLGNNASIQRATRGAKDDAARATLRDQCVAATKSLTAACR